LVFASAGPAFFGRVLPGHSNPYAALMNYLRSVNANRPLLAVRGQEGLWAALSRGETVFGWGISAMPSVHVASAILAALFGFHLSKPVGIVLTIVAVCAFVASVALGWHYSADGYAGAALACLIWWLAGRLTRRTPSAVEARM
jgi:membrane-associated phospholipid phosphatase